MVTIVRGVFFTRAAQEEGTAAELKLDAGLLLKTARKRAEELRRPDGSIMIDHVDDSCPWMRRSGGKLSFNPG